jgi:hypothetical protein
MGQLEVVRLVLSSCPLGRPSVDGRIRTGQTGTAKIGYTVEAAISACKAAEGTGAYLTLGEPGRLVVRDKLSSTLTGWRSRFRRHPAAERKRTTVD